MEAEFYKELSERALSHQRAKQNLPGKQDLQRKQLSACHKHYIVVSIIQQVQKHSIPAVIKNSVKYFWFSFKRLSSKCSLAH